MMPRPLKVLYVIHDSRRGGVQSVMLRVIAALDRRRIEPTVLFPFNGPCAEELRAMGVKVVTAGEQTPLFWRMKRFTMIPRLLELARQADIVHLNSVTLAIPAIAAAMSGARTVYHLHELPASIGPVLRGAIARADRTAFCSETCAKHFAGIAARKTVVLVNAVPLPDTVVRPEPGGVPKVVMLGSINRAKGQDLLLAAFRLVRQSAELHFYGNVGLSARGYAGRLQRIAAEAGLAGRVFFHPPTGDVAGVLAQTALLVHTSRRESFGMVLVEAMAAGVPVIANDIGGMREIVVDGESGYLVDADDPALLALRIESLLADRESSAKIGAAGRERVRDRFDIATRIEEYHMLYEQMAGSGE